MKTPSSKGFWIGVGFLAAFGIARAMTTPATQSKDVVGKPAPEFELESVSGETVKMSDFKGKVVLLDFWAVWCGPCKKSAPFFQELQDKYGEHGLEVVGLHVEDRVPPPAEVGEYLSGINVSYTNLLSTVDTDNEFIIFAMPTTYIIDREGVIVKRHIGFDPATAPAELEENVRSLLGID